MKYAYKCQGGFKRVKRGVVTYKPLGDAMECMRGLGLDVWLGIDAEHGVVALMCGRHVLGITHGTSPSVNVLWDYIDPNGECGMAETILYKFVSCGGDLFSVKPATHFLNSYGSDMLVHGLRNSFGYGNLPMGISIPPFSTANELNMKLQLAGEGIK